MDGDRTVLGIVAAGSYREEVIALVESATVEPADTVPAEHVAQLEAAAAADPWERSPERYDRTSRKARAVFDG